MKPFITIDEIIERALVLIAQHPLFREPIVLTNAGQPIRITKLRTFDGLDFNQGGMTLSIFPYSYQGTSNNTVTSNNVALHYEPYNIGNATEGFDRVKVALVCKLQNMGIEDQITPFNLENTVVNGQVTPLIIERKGKEVALYRWLPILRDILLTKPIQDLGGLIKNSTVNWATPETTKWEGRDGKNYVFHSASLLWQMELNIPRNWREFPSSVVLPDLGGTQGSWLYVGVRNIDKSPIYWDTITSQLVDLAGFPVLTTPKGLRVVWDPVDQRFERHSDGVTPLTPSELEDPRVGNQPWITTDLLLLGVLMPSRRNLFWHKVLKRLQLADGTVITQLDDGTPIAYDEVLGILIYGTSSPNAGQPLPELPGFLSVMTGRVNFFNANGLQLRDYFTF